MLTHLIVNALWIIGFSTLLTWEHSIFRVMGNRDEYPMWSKPLFACWPCMSSVHGGVYGWFVYQDATVILHVICLHGMLAITNYFVSNYE